LIRGSWALASTVAWKATVTAVAGRPLSLGYLDTVREKVGIEGPHGALQSRQKLFESRPPKRFGLRCSQLTNSSASAGRSASGSGSKE
jgi:hypothetical protein